MHNDEFEKDYPVNFGSGVRGIWYSYQGNDRAGLIIAHLHSDGSLCAGGVAIEGRAPTTEKEQWKVVQEEPLTLTPSIQSNDCSLHGHITNGKWVPA